MITTATKIYLLTNAIFALGISLENLPEGLLFGLFVAPFSLMFTAPLLVLISVLLWGLNRLRSTAAVAWLIFLAGIAAMTYLPFHMFSPDDDMHVLPVAYISSFTSILLLHKSVHRHFIRSQTVKTNVKRKAWSA